MKTFKIIVISIFLGVMMNQSTAAQEKAWYAVGHAHIDLAWLWPRSETIAHVCPNTFRDMLALMDEYPQFHFSQSAAQIYKWMEEYYPELFEHIKERIQEGRWEIIGGSWDEHNTNIPCGESLARQYLYGKRYFWEKFGVDVHVGWLVDVFGFNWNMPQIFQKSGIDYFCTHKLKWQVERMDPPMPFPYHIFWWEGPEGSRVLAFHTVGDYNEQILPDRMLKQMKTLEEKHGIPLQLIPFGKGDHGGGPFKEMIERGLALQKRTDVPEFHFSTAQQYFEKLESAGKKKTIPVITDELYVKTHRGTLTTDGQVKRDNRKCEALLLNGEKFAVIAGLFDQPYPKETLQDAWEWLLHGQVHDNIDGSSVAVVYYDADLDYRRIKKMGNEVLDASLQTLSDNINTMGKGHSPVVVYNSLACKRDGIVKIDITQDLLASSLSVFDNSGSVVPSQIIEEDGIPKLLFWDMRFILLRKL